MEFANKMLENHFQSAENRKKFFDEIAREKGFNPLVASNWYSISRLEVLARKVIIFYYVVYLFTFLKGSTTLLNMFHSSYPEALANVYGFETLDKKKFQRSPSKLSAML